MFIRETKRRRSKDSRTFYQYSLVQATRIDGKSRQRTILYLGADKELQDKEDRRMVLEVLKVMITGSPSLFDDIPMHLYKLAQRYYEKYKIKYADVDEVPPSIPPKAAKETFENIALDHIEIAENKSFGSEHLCLQTLDKLGLGDFLSTTGLDKEEVQKALISIAARAIYTSSEHKTANILELNSSLKECTGYKKSISYKQLYSISDLLYERKAKIDKYLYNHITDMFNIEDKIVIYDISNAYFESRKANSKLATYGRSKEKRYDCPIVVFTGVINAEGFIRHSRIYEGNKTDQATLSDMISDMNQYSESRDKTVVLDAGIATDENLEMLENQGYKYVCVARNRIKDYPETCLQNQIKQSTADRENEVGLSVFSPEAHKDTWMLVQSEAKKRKEESMRNKLRDRFEHDLDTAKAALHKKGGTKTIEKVWERIGRLKEKHSHVSGGYKITITEEAGKATAIQWKIKDNKIKQDKAKGIYFIRTNYKNPKEHQLWDIYNTIRKVESTFRCLKTDLNIRPVHHQKDERIKAHLYLSLLAYQLVNTIRYQLAQSNINYDWTNIVRIMQTQQIQTIELPTATKTIHLRKPSKPINEVKQIYDATGCTHTQKTIKKYVVYH